MAKMKVAVPTKDSHAVIQAVDYRRLDYRRLYSYDVECITEPTQALLHQAARFLLVHRGDGVIRLQNQEFHLRKGALLSILPWQRTEVVAVEEPIHYSILKWDLEITNQVLKNFLNVARDFSVELIDNFRRHALIVCNPREYKEVFMLFRSLRNTLGLESIVVTQQELDGLDNISVMGKLLSLLIFCLRWHQKSESENSGGNRCCEKTAWIDKNDIFGYMYAHLAERLKLEELAHVFGEVDGGGKIEEYISRTTGLSFGELLDTMRTTKAIEFLLHTEMPVEMIANLLGYAEVAHFSKRFSAVVGLSPLRFRKVHGVQDKINKSCDPDFSIRIVNHIVSHSSENLHDVDVARQFGLTVFELNKYLVYHVEKSFHEFLSYLRIARASELLARTHQSIIDISFEVGFNSVKTFTRHFIGLQGMTPNAFRNALKLQQRDIGK